MQQKYKYTFIKLITPKKVSFVKRKALKRQHIIKYSDIQKKAYKKTAIYKFNFYL